MRVLDLFSGIGGFSLGLERAGMETVAFCEFDEKARLVLKKHWPDIPIYTDVRELDGEQLKDIYPIELICGGFPCPAFSRAGKGGGFAKDDLFFEVIRICREIKPKWILLENVEGFTKWRETALDEIQAAGYEWEDCIFDARDFGIPQGRRRWFAICFRRGMLSHPQHIRRFQGVQVESLYGIQSYITNTQRGWTPAISTKDEWRAIGVNAKRCRNHNGVPNRMDRLKQLGNAVVPQVVEQIGRAIMEANNRRKKGATR